MNEIAKILLEIGAEPIRKRRQNLFFSLYERYEGVLHPLISLSLVLNANINITPKENFSEKYTSFSNFLGNLVYFFINDETQLLLKEIRKYPKDWQVIAQWVLGNKFKNTLSLEFIYTLIPSVLTLKELNTGFLEIPDFIDLKTKQEVIFSEEPEKLSYPFYFIRVSTKIRGRGQLRYYYKTGETIETNITSKAVRDYLADSLLGKFKVGVLLLTATEKVGSHKWNIQPIILSEDIDTLKNLYRGRGESEFVAQSRLMLGNIFKQTSNKVKVFNTKPILCNSVHDLPSLNSGLVPKNLLLHKFGITNLSFQVEKRYYKVFDYLFNDDFEPIGLKLLDDNKDIVEVEAKIDDAFVERGIENAYAKIAVYKFEDEVLQTTFNQLLNKHYGECAACGVIAHLKKSGLCFACQGKLFREAVENGDKLEFVSDKLLTKYTKIGFITFLYKYEIEFTEKGMYFKECDWCWRGKQQYLPYDWWA